ncbi:MAG: hypothetical protein QM809_08180 [Gordonia sp. (in: high G+C Gram-positive bacteria)]|uniref:hypothetical protein n=1 Tax=Gordonia sp. (in: high G+C Gram-positive bacteria) TaxID=84139 RepID=UPI0039E365E4
MTELTVAAHAVQTFAATSAALSSATAAAGTADAAAQAAVMTGAFGLIGQEFLAAFAVAQSNHLASVGALAAVQAATATAATAGLGEFAAADTGGANALRGVVPAPGSGVAAI